MKTYHKIQEIFIKIKLKMSKKGRNRILKTFNTKEIRISKKMIIFILI